MEKLISKYDLNKIDFFGINEKEIRFSNIKITNNENNLNT